MGRAMVISIKPEFGDKILNGSKKIELRKSIPKVGIGDIVVLYITVPVKSVIGICKVQDILQMDPEKMWEQHSLDLGIDKERYLKYFEGYELAIGIVLMETYPLKTHLGLDRIKEKFPKFSPPQTFRYFSKWQIMRGYKLV